MTKQQFGERAEYGTDDFCYRHADRPSFTLCQRCGKTICPDCQTNNAVGVLCPACVRETQPTASTRFIRTTRATARKASRADTPVITYTIMALCLLTWLTQILFKTTAFLAYAPVFSTPLAFEPWRLVTAMFAHSQSGIWHITFNMLTLYMFGRNLEIWLGKTRYLVLYLLSGIAGSITVMLWGLTSYEALITPVVGASGALFGVIGATLVTLRTLNVDARGLVFMLAINLGIGFLPGANISWQAHLGGLIAGALIMLIYTKFSAKNKTGWLLISGFAALMAVACCSFYIYVQGL